MKVDVFFETITHAHRPLVAWFLARGCRVFVFDFTCHLKKMRWLCRLINSGRVQRIYVQPQSSADGLAMDAVEWLYPRVAAQDRLVQALTRHFGVAEARLVLKKALLDSVFQYCYIHVTLKRCVATASDGRDVIVVPDLYRHWESLLRGWRVKPLERVGIPRWVQWWSEAAGAFDRFWKQEAACLYGSVVLAWAWCARRFGPQRPARYPITVEHAYAIDQPFQTQFQRGRGFDFLIDGEQLTKANTAFLVHRNAQGPWLEVARDAGYRVLGRSELTRPLSYWSAPPRMLDLRGLGRLVLRTAMRPRGPAWITWTAAAAAMVALEDAVLCERLVFANYIYTNSAGRIQRWHNVMVRRAGRQSWCFPLAIGGGYLYGEEGALDPAQIQERSSRACAYQNHDQFVGASRQMIAYHQQHRQGVRAYHQVGNLWSEQVRQACVTGEGQRLRQAWFGRSLDGRNVVAWFDTTFVEAEHSVSTYTESIAWYADLLRLLEDDERLLMVIKPSKSEAWFMDEQEQWFHPLGARVMEQWQKLRQHPRVHFERSEEDPSGVIAASDLTITFCFSSPSAEALGARKRAIWYEPGARWRHVLYGRDPLLTAHGYGELTSLVRKLLYEMSDAEYEAYLDQRVKGLVEDFLDGKALSRFRDLLAAGTRPPQPQTAVSAEPVLSLCL